MTYPAQQHTALPRNGLGTAALVLGIIAFVLAWIPFIGFFGFIISMIAMPLGGVGIYRGHVGTATNTVAAYIGAGLGFVAFWASLITFAAVMVPAASEQINSSAPAPPVTDSAPVPAAPVPVAPAPAAPGPAEQYSARVEVFGEATASDVSVSVFDEGSSNMENTVTLPYSKDLPEGYTSVSVSAMPSLDSYMNGTEASASGDVGCRIIRNGQVVDEQTATGDFASATCSKFY